MDVVEADPGIEQVQASGQHKYSTRRDDLGMLIGGLWITAGLFLDGYAHRQLLDGERESFLTPWHLILYTGYVGAAVWCTRVLRQRRRNPLIPPAHAIPVGYRLSVLGFALFALGGIFDAIWHSLYGLEESIEALLSPSHLLLFVGFLLIVSTTARASWHRDDRVAGSLLSFFPVILSWAATTAVIGFFLQFVWGIGHRKWFAVEYVAATEAGAGYLTAGVGTAAISTVVLLGSALLIARRWHPPFGTFSIGFALVNIPLVLALDLHESALVSGVASGLVMDIGLRYGLAADSWRVRAQRAATCTAATMWIAFFAVKASIGGLEWSVEIWGGVILLAALCGYGLALLAFPAGPLVDVSQPRDA